MWANMPSLARCLQHSQNPMIWLSLWSTSLRHSSLFTMLIKWKPWNDWGNSGILSSVWGWALVIMIFVVVVMCLTLWWWMLALYYPQIEDETQTLPPKYIWFWSTFRPLYLPPWPQASLPWRQWAWRGREMAERRCVIYWRKGWGRSWLPLLMVEEIPKRKELENVYTEKAEWIQVASLCFG